MHCFGIEVIKLTDRGALDGTIGNVKMEVSKDGQCLEEPREEQEEVVADFVQLYQSSTLTFAEVYIFGLLNSSYSYFIFGTFSI